jgi:hypothetical protein
LPKSHRPDRNEPWNGLARFHPARIQPSLPLMKWFLTLKLLRSYFDGPVYLGCKAWHSDLCLEKTRPLPSWKTRSGRGVPTGCEGAGLLDGIWNGVARRSLEHWQFREKGLPGCEHEQVLHRSQSYNISSLVCVFREVVHQAFWTHWKLR